MWSHPRQTLNLLRHNHRSSYVERGLKLHKNIGLRSKSGRDNDICEKKTIYKDFIKEYKKNG